MVVDGDGNILAGRNARSGPNLFGMLERQAATVGGFRYSGELVKAGQLGQVRDADTFVSHTLDPVSFLKTFLDDGQARGKMTFKVQKSDDAANLHAFFRSFGPTIGRKGMLRQT